MLLFLNVSAQESSHKSLKENRSEFINKPKNYIIFSKDTSQYIQINNAIIKLPKYYGIKESTGNSILAVIDYKGISDDSCFIKFLDSRGNFLRCHLLPKTTQTTIADDGRFVMHGKGIRKGSSISFYNSLGQPVHKVTDIYYGSEVVLFDTTEGNLILLGFLEEKTLQPFRNAKFSIYDKDFKLKGAIKLDWPAQTLFPDPIINSDGSVILKTYRYPSGKDPVRETIIIDHNLNYRKTDGWD